MKIVRLSISALLALTFASNTFAALSKEYADFPKGPAQHLLTDEERAQWKNIKTDDAAKAFLDLFWARRDPSPGTAVNENKDLFDARVKVADGNFREPKRIGSMTDRGKAFILMGSPTKIVQSHTGPTSTIQQPDSTPLGVPQGNTTVQGYSPKVVWVFEQAKVPYTLGQPIAELAFIDQYGSNDWKMDKVITTDPKSLFDRVVKNAWITQPNLTEVPVYTAAAATAPVAITSAPVAITTTAAPAKLTAFSNDVLRAAIDEARAAKAAVANETLFVTYGEYITPDGQHFVPVQIYAPKSAGLAPGEATFFGAIDTEAGEQVAIYEEKATLVASNEDVVFAKSLELAPGKYRGVFGLAKDGKPVSVVTKPIVIAGLDKAAPSASQLILSGNVYPMTEAQQPTDPYAFGGLKVVPRGSLTFRQSEDLWYFAELRNPGVDAATSQPKLNMKFSLKGTTAEGKSVKYPERTEPAQAIELKGVTGHWGVGQALPLASIKPGTYTMTVTVTDDILAKSYELSETFKVIP